MENQFAWREGGSELSWHLSTIYTALARLSNMPGGERGTGAGDRNQRDREEIANGEALGEKNKARRRAHRRLEAHQDAKQLARKAAQRGELEREGNRRG